MGDFSLAIGVAVMSVPTSDAGVVRVLAGVTDRVSVASSVIPLRGWSDEATAPGAKITVGLGCGVVFVERD